MPHGDRPYSQVIRKQTLEEVEALIQKGLESDIIWSTRTVIDILDAIKKLPR